MDEREEHPQCCLDSISRLPLNRSLFFAEAVGLPQAVVLARLFRLQAWGVTFFDLDFPDEALLGLV